MGTPFKAVYSAFLARIEQDTWMFESELDYLEKDWFELMKMAINRFMFPRISLEFDEDAASFNENLGLEEIQILAIFMKNEWYKRCLSTYKLIQQQYHTADFEFSSQANHMEKLQELVKLSNNECLNITNVYSRSRNHTPFDWSQLAGR